jgi:hypothetical protein
VVARSIASSSICITDVTRRSSVRVTLDRRCIISIVFITISNVLAAAVAAVHCRGPAQYTILLLQQQCARPLLQQQCARPLLQQQQLLLLLLLHDQAPTEVSCAAALMLRSL